VHFVQRRGSVEQHCAIVEYQGRGKNVRGIVSYYKTIGSLKWLAVRYIELGIAQNFNLLGVKETRCMQNEQKHTELGQMAGTGVNHEIEVNLSNWNN
jgi:hypothetical protein